MLLKNKAYYHERRNSETVVLSDIHSKLDQLQLSQSVEGLQSASVGQNIDIDVLTIDGTSTVGRYQHRIFVSSLQRAKAIFEQSNNYPALQVSSRGYSPINKTYRRIAELGADNETYKYTLEWLELLRGLVTSDQMWWREPLVNLGIDSEIVFEWWHEKKKLTVYILGSTVEYIKVWGIDIDNEMEDGSATSPTELTDLWKWLVS